MTVLRRGGLPRPGRRLLAGVALLVVAAGVVVAVTGPFTGSSPAASGAADNGTATSLQTVTRRSLTSQTQVDGTLGYADSSTVSLPAGTAPSSIRQAEQALAGARQTLASAQAALAADRQALTQAQSRLTADRLKERSDCAGANAAQSSGAGNGSAASGGAPSPCAAATEAVAADETALTTAGQKLTGDQGQVASAQTSLSGAEQSLAAAQSSAVVYDTGAAYTMLPQAGDVIRRGQPLYAIDGEPTLLMYGSVAAWRAFRPGMAPGEDVAQLNRNLDALGYGHGLAGTRFTAETEQAIAALQSAHALTRTGVLLLGSVAFASGAVRVTSVTPTLGQVVQSGQSGQAGAILSVTSTRHQVAIQLDAAHQSQISVGDRVIVTLPDNSTTPGVVSKVGKVATAPSSDQGNGGSSAPTIEVDVRLLHGAAAGSLDQAPVSVAVTTGSVDNVLVVPVNALLALAGGGYAVELAEAGGAHRLAAVELGLFDDAEGLVQVSGPSLRAGQRVVVPAS